MLRACSYVHALINLQIFPPEVRHVFPRQLSHGQLVPYLAVVLFVKDDGFSMISPPTSDYCKGSPYQKQ